MMSQRMFRPSGFTVFVCLLVVLCLRDVNAEVKVSAKDGFQIEITKVVSMKPEQAYDSFVTDLPRWWDIDHTYTQKRDNLSLDLDKHCLLERLPKGGFVRHMEVVFHQPGKVLRLSGGLGPLQGMGVAGAMTIAFEPLEDGKTRVKLNYVVTGASFQNLDSIAKPVDQVLGQQLTCFYNFCESQEK